VSDIRLPPGYRLEHHASVGSTMDLARAAAEAGAAAGLVVWADEQTAGRGRQGRGWSSPPGNLYATLLLRPPGPALAGALYGFAASLALAEALTPLLGRGRVTLKWPNDLLIDGAKAAGVLLESRASAAGLEWLLLGTGVNLASAPADTPYAATSVAAAGAALAPRALLEHYIESFALWRNRLEQEGFDGLRSAWLERAAGRGQALTARLPQETLSGIFRDLDRDGALVLELADGRRRRVTAANVRFG